MDCPEEERDGGNRQQTQENMHTFQLLTRGVSDLTVREHLITIHTDDTDLTLWAGWKTPFQIGP